LRAPSPDAMKSILFNLFSRASDLIDVQPVVALFLGGAVLTVFLTALFSPKPAEPNPNPDPKPSLLWTLYRQATRLLWAVTLVSFLIATLSIVRVYLHQAVARFQRTHGRVTEANFNAIQTIWGTPQEQGELLFKLYYEEEITERIESEDVTKPAVLRKKTVRHDITDNPFVSERHEVTLKQNPRKKGSAMYVGYETTCRFTWKLRSPANRELKSDLKFPLPAATAIYSDLTATLNGEDVLPRMQLKDGLLQLAREVKPQETLELAISFKSRGMSYWYMQVREPREIRDFTFALNLPDLSKTHLNFPEGCMTPTDTRATADKKGTVLTFRLDHAISGKGMGIALPSVSQPGETTNAVLGEVERGWLLIFAMLAFSLTLAGIPHAVLLSVLFGAACACGYGLLGDFSDVLLGFWGTACLVLVPIFLLLAWLLKQVAPAGVAKALAAQFLLFGIVYPSVAGLDAERQSLYFNLAALVFISLVAWQLARKLWNGADAGKSAG
jgi:hypothetical protein